MPAASSTDIIRKLPEIRILGHDGKNPPADAGDTGAAGSTPGSRRSPGVGNGNPRQDSSLEKSMDRGAWWATVHRVAKSQTGLSIEQNTPTT